MPNGNLTTKEWLIKIDQKLEDFIDNCKSDKDDHSKEHNLMWKLIIGIPSTLFLLFSIVLIIIKVSEK